jgi:glycosyltransferase involved in cell wall biosynthesis
MCSLSSVAVWIAKATMSPLEMNQRRDYAREVQLTPRQLSVIVPVYGSEAILPELVRRLECVLAANADEFEIVLVNDSSPDGSWNVICDLALENSFIRAVNLMRNYGQHNALLCGIRTARYEVIVTIDDDLQHPPEEIPKLLAKLAERYDVIYGTPQQEQHGLGRDFASWFTKLALQNVMGADIARKVCAFRAFRTQVAKAFEHYEGSFVSIDVLLTWGTNRFASVPVVHKPRTQGASGYTFRKLMTHAMNMMTGFSTMPLQIASLVGFVFTFFGLLVLVYVLARFLLHGDPVPGFPFLASIVALFSGAQLFALGIIGEYLARMHLRALQKPPYVVRELRSETSPATNKAVSSR